MIISISEVLKFINSGEIFSCKVVSYDRKRKKGGEIQEYLEAALVKKDQRPKVSRSLTIQEQKRHQLETLKKDPHHKKWYTRNIRIYQQGIPTVVIKKIHPPLLIEFNKKKVVP